MQVLILKNHMIWLFLLDKEIKCYMSLVFKSSRQRAQTQCPASRPTHAVPTSLAQTLVGTIACGIGELMMNGCEGFVIAQAPLWGRTMDEDTSLAQESNG